MIGSLLFILYVADLADIVDRHAALVCRRYTDVAGASTQLKMCIADVSQWMSANRLKLNTDKTKLLWARLRHSVSQFQGPVIELGADTVLP